MRAYVFEFQYDANGKSEYTTHGAHTTIWVCVCDVRIYSTMAGGTWNRIYSYCFAVIFTCVRASTCVSVLVNRMTNWKIRKNTNNNNSSKHDMPNRQATSQNWSWFFFASMCACVWKSRFTYGTAAWNYYTTTHQTYTHRRAHKRKAADRYSKITNKHRDRASQPATLMMGKHTHVPSMHRQTHAHIHTRTWYMCQTLYRVVSCRFASSLHNLPERTIQIIALDSNTNEWIRQCGRMYAAISRLLPTIDGWVQILYYTLLYSIHIHTSTLTRTHVHTRVHCCYTVYADFIEAKNE